MHSAASSLASLLLLATPLAASPPAGVVNARVESRSAASGLEPALRAVLSSRSGPSWVGWAVATNGRQSVCCWSSLAEAGDGCGGCQLEREKGHGSFERSPAVPLHLEAGDRVRVLVRAEAGRVTRVRALSESCGVDVGGLPFVWLEDVRPAESVAFLATLVEAPPDQTAVDDPAMAVIAFHADPGADAALERFVARDQPLERRRRAAFWLGQARGERGSLVLSRLVRDDPDSRFREHVVFALSQSREPKAVDTIIDVARNDPSAHVRGQALFWLAQTAARRAPQAIRAALDDDPEIEVKKKAVFALSQLPKDEGVPLLIGLARSHKSDEVRKQAMFWLGQSGDPRALAFFEDVLAR
jgi:HEAT repeats